MIEASKKMLLDTSYDQLLRMLATRGLEWLRQQIEALPAPLPPDNPGIVPLAAAGRIAPVLSGLRGRISPLEVLVARRLTPELAIEAAAQALSCRDSHAAVGGADILLAGRSIASDHPLWQLACDHVAEDPDRDLVDRLALGAPTDHLLPEAEAILTADMPDQVLTEAWIDRFARLLMQLYAHGAERPRFSDANIYGQVFTNCLRFCDWARHQRSLVATAQMAFCLRLIDPDHDLAPILAEVIPYQRPDGSFPARCGYSEAEQDFATGFRPTLMTVAALHLCTYRRWRSPPVLPAPVSPFHASRDLAANLLATQLMPHLTQLPAETRLHAAAVLSSATGENWFQRAGLTGHPIQADQVLRMAPRVFGSFAAARFARSSLAMESAWDSLRQADAHGAVRPAHLALALDWLRGAPVAIGDALPPDLVRDWQAAALSGDTVTYHACCERAAGHRVTAPADTIRKAARCIVVTDLQALEATSDDAIDDRLVRLARLNLLAQLFEPDIWLAAVA